MSLFWINFWSTFCASIAVVVALSVFGYLAKGRIVTGLKRFIKEEVIKSVFTVEDVKHGKEKNTNETD